MASTTDPEVGSFEWIAREIARLAYDRSDILEGEIRRMAELAVGHPKTYRGGLVFPYTRVVPWCPDGIEPLGDATFAQLMVRLPLHLEHSSYRYAAQLTIEAMLRHQIKELFNA